jgi:transposase-like protein
MKKISYKGYRFPPEIIQQAIWLYVRFTLSLRDVEDLLAERGIMVSYETVRRGVNRSDSRSRPIFANAGRSHIRLGISRTHRFECDAISLAFFGG